LRLAPIAARWHDSRVADLLADVRRVRQVADVFGPASTALSMRKVAERALEHDDEESGASRISRSLSWNAARRYVDASSAFWRGYGGRPAAQGGGGSQPRPRGLNVRRSISGNQCYLGKAFVARCGERGCADLARLIWIAACHSVGTIWRDANMMEAVVSRGAQVQVGLG
jgi:hypothetical protein